jgi:hypothetical protein
MSHVYTCFVWNSLFAVFPYLLGLILFIGYVPKMWFTDHQWSVSLMQVVHGKQARPSQWKRLMFGFYMPTFRNTLFHLLRRIGMKDDLIWKCWSIYTGKGLAQAIFESNLFPYKYSKIFEPSHPKSRLCDWASLGSGPRQPTNQSLSLP